ncbi:FUSC family protein [Kitasatospora sp. NPDC089509]|uniref:FUSC family protein n=1 Tax=Kitasatospora sp. NPDC089509 TaxID=3364079 RepID=UPI0037FAFA60
MTGTGERVTRTDPGTPGPPWPARLMRLLRGDEARGTFRRALWLVLAGCTGFYVLDYGFGRPQMALYSVFGALPLVLFAKLPGPPRARARVLLTVLPVAWLMVTAGTLLAVTDWAAALGLLVVGFLASLLEVVGPRAAVLAAAVQLYYVLPCFPPYEPDQLGYRLGGITVGILLTVVTDQLLWADPPPAPYRLRLAEAAAALAGYCAAAGADPRDRPDLADARRRVDEAQRAALLAATPPDARPTSVSLRDRGLTHTRVALAYLSGRIADVVETGAGSGPDAGRLLAGAAAVLERVAGNLRSAARDGDALELVLLVRDFDGRREQRAAVGVPGAEQQRDAALRAVAEAVLVVDRASRIALGDRLPAGQDPSGPFGYAVLSTPAWLLARLRLHLHPRSVLFQNAVRLSVALAVARLVVGAFDLPHGFWVLLALLSLMRTSAADTRTALLPSVIGTVAGALVSVAMLTVVEHNPVFYAVATPIAFLVGFTVCPLLKPWWIQAMITLAMVLIFGQITDADWGIPTLRVVNVLVGGLIGTVAALVAWPRGAHGQLRSDVADLLDRSGEGVRAVTDRLCGKPVPATVPLAATRRALLLAQSTHLQYRNERMYRTVGDPPWGANMLVGYDVLTGGSLLLARHAAAGPAVAAAAPAVAERLTAGADLVRAECEQAAAELRAGGAGDRGHPGPAAEGPGSTGRTDHGRADPVPAEALLVADTEAWFAAVAADTARSRAARSEGWPPAPGTGGHQGPAR